MLFDRRSMVKTFAAAPLIVSGACAAGQQPRTADIHRRSIPGANDPVPVIGIGTARRYADPGDEAQWAQLRATVARFAELGGRLIDTAPSYGRAEEVIGTLVADLGLRNRLFLATKVGATGESEGRAQIEQSFRNLRTSVIDLIAVHNLRDIETQLPILRELKSAGRIRAIGATTSARDGFAPTAGAMQSSPSDYAPVEAVMRREPMDVIQVDYAIDNRDAGNRILPLAQDLGMAVMINLPFGRGRLFEATRGQPLPDWAAEIGASSWAQVFLKYVVSHPVRPIAIPGMAQPRYVDDNLGAARGPLPDAAMRLRMEQYIDAL